MDCLFLSEAPGLHRCQRCGLPIRSAHPPGRIHRRCRIASEEPATLARTASRRAICTSCGSFDGHHCRLFTAAALGCGDVSAWSEALSGVDNDALGCPAGKW